MRPLGPVVLGRYLVPHIWDKFNAAVEAQEFTGNLDDYMHQVVLAECKTEVDLRRFLGLDYPTWEEASAAARRLGIKSQKEYNKRYKEDPKLPSRPNIIYTSDWREKGGWLDFLNSKGLRRGT